MSTPPANDVIVPAPWGLGLVLGGVVLGVVLAAVGSVPNFLW
jgi:hypothetical protein